MTILLVQPPFVQLNAPYPAIYYLKGYCDNAGIPAQTVDLSHAIIGKLYSPDSLSRIFHDAGEPKVDAPEYESMLAIWLQREERIRLSREAILFLRGQKSYDAPLFAKNGWLPTGWRRLRLASHLDSLPDDTKARLAATLFLEETADFIANSLDPHFSPARYAERKTMSARHFSDIEPLIGSSYVLNTLLDPLLEELRGVQQTSERFLFALSVPFPGVLVPALHIGAWAKRFFPGSLVALGGGYVSTELRNVSSSALFSYCDLLVYDEGLNALSELAKETHLPSIPGIAYLDGNFGGVHNTLPGNDSASPVSSIFPVYTNAAFSELVPFAETGNPMHDLWSSRPWLKYYISHGCYHRRCTFCDTSLPYVAHYRPTNPSELFERALADSRETGIRGIHFTDEAMPPAHLLAFSELNRSAGRPLFFWGNLRLEPSLTNAKLDFLAGSGLLAITTGLETVTEPFLKSIDKGFSLSDAVRIASRLRSRGVLVHFYLIYGYPGQTEVDIIDSLEIVRQLFAGSIINSAFWHRFVLTRHSPLYRNPPPSLKPLDTPWDFASNDIPFEGEEFYDRFSEGLETALYNWVHGKCTADPVSRWFPFQVPKPRIPYNHVRQISELIHSETIEVNALIKREKTVWLGSPFIIKDAHPNVLLEWEYQGVVKKVKISPLWARYIVDAVEKKVSPASFFKGFSETTGFPADAFVRSDNFRKLVNNGLLFI